ncbi:MAG: PilN domain-containing protein [Magnetococcales bacterium]|nr:PilN domain-containing protein [Magnetococcales bacterium]
MRLSINLLPSRSARRLAKVNRLFALWGGVALLGVGVALGVNLHFEAHLAELNTKKAENETTLKLLEKQLGEIADIKAKRELVRQRLDLVAQLSRSRDLTLRVLDTISQQIPEKVWLTRLTTRGNTLELLGKAQSNALVADLMSALERSLHLTHVDLTRVARPAKEETEMKEFTVTARIQPPPEPVDPKAKSAPKPDGEKK